MNSAAIKTLLALLLALRELQDPLSSDERALLQDAGQQLALDPNDWEFIEEGLIAAIASNPTLNRLYQSNKAKIDALGQIPRGLLPSLAELQKELFPETKEVITFDGTPKGDRQQHEVITLTGAILETENQAQSAKAKALEPLAGYVEAYRFFNTYFGNPGSEAMIPASQPLVSEQSYLLCVEISPERKGIDQQPQPFPDEALSQVWNDRGTLSLDVAVTSKDFQIDASIKPLILPRRGASERVQFVVRPQKMSGRGHLCVELFYRGYLLQAKRLNVQIVPLTDTELPESLRPAQTARTTFTTTDLLSNEQLAQLPERVLTLDVERDSRDGSLDFRILDRARGNQELAFYDTTLESASLGSAIARIRRQLDLTLRDGYWGEVEGSPEQLNTWLPQLADAGRELYRQLFRRNPGGLLPDEREELLQATLKPDTVIQVNPISGQVTIPWALLYERKVKPSKRTRVCDRFSEHDFDCSDCPNKENPNIVCPHAFWGYRYAIEQLPCWVGSQHSAPLTLLRQIDNKLPLCMSFNVYRDFQLWQDHLCKLEAMGGVELQVAEELPQLEMIWDEHGRSLDLVYFYCHGGAEPITQTSSMREGDRAIENIVSQRPYLQLSDERIYSNFLECYEATWKHNPLVFLNGCATGDYGPESYVSLIDDFLNAGASGVVGTECPVSEKFAEYYASEVFQHLFAGEQMGQAMLAARRDLLQRYNNPLGLVYALYAAHEIALARSVAHS